MTHELERYKQILGFHDLRIYNYGPNAVFATVDVEIDSNWTLDHAHEVIDDIERDFKKRLNVILVAHMDPIDLTNRHYNKIHQAIKDIVAAYDLDLHTHDFHVEETRTGELVQFDVVVPHNIGIPDDVLNHRITRDLEKDFPKLRTEINFDHNYIGEDQSTFTDAASKHH